MAITIRAANKRGARRGAAVRGRTNMTHTFRTSVKYAVRDAQKNGNPIARYDTQKKRAYLEYPDGRKQYVG